MPEPSASQVKFLVDLEPIGRRIEVPVGTDLLTAAQHAGVELVAACGGVGICGTCLVRLASGRLSELTSTEEDLLTPEQMVQGYRLACQSIPISDVRLDIPAESLTVGQRLQVDGSEFRMVLDPAVTALDVTLTAPTLEDLRSDWTRAANAVSAVAAEGLPPLVGELAQISQLSDHLRKSGWRARLALAPLANTAGQTRLVGAFPSGERLLGLAVDMGSTKLAVFLLDLADGAVLGQAGVMNPQIAFGEDVVSRIAYANRAPENRRLLQSRLVDTLNQVTLELCRAAGVSQRQIVDAVLVGNTAMHHFLCGLPVAQLGAAPYVAAASEALEVRAAEVGLELAPGARLYLPPNIAGFVGADHTAALLASAMDAPGETRVLVDIGTNTEISLAHGAQIRSCSTASGPAFEGAHIRDGMRAAPGAIEKVTAHDGYMRVVTVGGLAPVGICGTGILSAISELYRAGIVDQRGALKKGAPGVRHSSGEITSPHAGPSRTEYLLVPAAQSGHGRDIVITRSDIHEIQLAKGAIRAGIEILLKESGLSAADVDAWIIAGAFGTYLDLRSAQRIGMFPPMPLERFHQVGNAAGVGARQLLLSRTRRAQASRLIEHVEYIELTAYAGFTPAFVDAMYFEERE